MGAFHKSILSMLVSALFHVLPVHHGVQQCVYSVHIVCVASAYRMRLIMTNVNAPLCLSGCPTNGLGKTDGNRFIVI